MVQATWQLMVLGTLLFIMGMMASDQMRRDQLKNIVLYTTLITIAFYGGLLCYLTSIVCIILALIK